MICMKDTVLVEETCAWIAWLARAELVKAEGTNSKNALFDPPSMTSQVNHAPKQEVLEKVIIYTGLWNEKLK